MDFKRQPFLEKRISEINPEKEINVCILGRVIDAGEGMAVIDDGSGRVNVVFNADSALKNLKINDIVRLFGYVIPTVDGFDIRGDMFQDMKSLDVGLFEKIKSC